MRSKRSGPSRVHDIQWVRFLIYFWGAGQSKIYRPMSAKLLHSPPPLTQPQSRSFFFFFLQICIRQCPQENWFSDKLIENPPRNWRSVRERLICEDGSITKSINSVESLKKALRDEKCAPYYVKSTSGWYCDNKILLNDVPVPKGTHIFQRALWGDSLRVPIFR